MRSFELQPIPENILNTFEKDLIGRNVDILHFLELLNSLESGSSIALDGRWGAGKTFFVKQVKMVMDTFNDHVTSEYSRESERIKAAWRHIREHEKFEIQPQVSVYYDAWLNDNDEDPILSLVYTILQSVSTDFEFKRGSECIELAAGIMEAITGRNLTTVIEVMRSADPLSSLREKKDIHAQIEMFLESLLPEKGNRLVVFVDELDRCKPTFAVRLLERIKHYFSNDRITFVFSVNTSELQHTIKRYYGAGFNASKYLERFFDFRVDLPPADMRGFYQEIGLNDGTWVYEKICKIVVEELSLTLREIAKFYRMAKTAAYKPMHDNRYRPVFVDEKALQFCLMCVVPVMIGLKISDQSKYDAFVRGEDAIPLHRIMRDNSVAISLCNSMLNANETYANTSVSGNRKVVRLTDKLNQVYDALFIYQYTSRVDEKQIGEMSFNEETKAELLKAVSALSDYADYDI